jgi:hypothetical protein
MNAESRATWQPRELTDEEEAKLISDIEAQNSISDLIAFCEEFSKHTPTIKASGLDGLNLYMANVIGTLASIWVSINAGDSDTKINQLIN